MDQCGDDIARILAVEGTASHGAARIAETIAGNLDRSEVPPDQARAAGPFMLCEDWRLRCPASDDGYCAGGYAVDGDDWLRCHAED